MLSICKRLLAAPLMALVALAMSAPQALSSGHPSRPPTKPHPGMGTGQGGAVHRPPQGRKPNGGLNYHPPTSKKPIQARKAPEMTGKKTATLKDGKPGVSRPGIDRPGVTKLPPGVTGLPTANSDRRWWGGWWGGWEGRWWDREDCWHHCDDHWWRHHGPWWSQSPSGDATSSVSMQTQPASPATEPNIADIIREMTRSLETEKPAKFVDDQPKREK